LDRRNVTDIHEVVIRELGMQHEIAEAGLPTEVHLGHSRDIADAACLRIVELELTALLGYEQPAVGQKLQSPGLIEVRDLVRFEGLALGLGCAECGQDGEMECKGTFTAHYDAPWIRVFLTRRRSISKVLRRRIGRILPEPRRRAQRR